MNRRALPWAFLSYGLVRAPKLQFGNFQVVAKEAGRRVKRHFNNRAEALEFVRVLRASGVKDIELTPKRIGRKRKRRPALGRRA